MVLQLMKNVSCVFTKFVSEGKCTIRLCEPSVDIAVSKVNMYFEGRAIFQCTYLCEFSLWLVLLKTLTRSSAIAETPTWCSVSVEVLACCYTDNANRSYVSLRCTFCYCHFFSATYIVLFTRHCRKLSYHTASVRCSVSQTCNAEVSRVCHQTFLQPTLSLSTGP